MSSMPGRVAAALGIGHSSPLPKTFDALRRLEEAGTIKPGWEVENVDEYLATLLDRWLMHVPQARPEHHPSRLADICDASG